MLDRFKLEQPIAFKMLGNALRQNKVAHAYLFTGDRQTNKLDAAILFAQSLVCPNPIDGYGCEECDTCLRIKNGQFADMVFVDGKQATIKKEEVLNIQRMFSNTALEVYGKKIYIVDECENASISAQNSLLKFLEEPQGDVVAILCANQVERLLPTIVSRCQMIPFKQTSKEQLFSEALAQDVNILDAHILSKWTNKIEDIIEILDTDEYQVALSLWIEFAKKLEDSKEEALFYLQTEGFTTKRKAKNKVTLEWFLNIGVVYCQDMIYRNKIGYESWDKLVDNTNFDINEQTKILEVLLSIRDDLLRNVNVLLTIDRLGYLLIKEV